MGCGEAPRPELPESSAVLSKPSVPAVQTVTEAQGGQAGLCALGRLSPPRGTSSLPGQEGSAPAGEPGNEGVNVSYSGKDGRPFHAMSPGKSPPLSLSFPKVCPGLGRLLAGADATVPRG